MRVSKQFKKWLGAVIALLMVAQTAIIAAPHKASASPTGDNVVISQIYWGADYSESSVFTSDFIELYNPTGKDISLDGWSVQYADDQSFSDLWIIKLSGTIKAYSYYLIQGREYDNEAEPLPTPDLVSRKWIDYEFGRVALVSSTVSLENIGYNDITEYDIPQIVDFVGYGYDYQYEGSGAVSSFGASEAAIRKAYAADETGDSGFGASYDTDDNQNDFIVGQPNPRNSSVKELPNLDDLDSPLSSRPDGRKILFDNDKLYGYPNAVEPNAYTIVYDGLPGDGGSVIEAVYAEDDGSFEARIDGNPEKEDYEYIYVTSVEKEKLESHPLLINRAHKTDNFVILDYEEDLSKLGTISGHGERNSYVFFYEDPGKTKRLTSVTGSVYAITNSEGRFAFDIIDGPETVYVTQVEVTNYGMGLESDAEAVTKVLLVTALSTLHKVDENGVSPYVGQQFTVEGTVAVDYSSLKDEDGYYSIQDSDWGMLVHIPASSTASFKPGDYIRAAGVLTQTNGTLTFEADFVEKLYDNARYSVYSSHMNDIKYNVENLEGRLVKFEVTVLDVLPNNEDFDITVSDPDNENNEFLVRIKSQSGINLDNTLQKSKTYWIQGLLLQDDPTSPYTSGYYLLPLSDSDIEPASKLVQLTVTGEQSYDLIPAFDPEITDYEVVVGPEEDEVIITAVPEDENEVVLFEGEDITPLSNSYYKAKLIMAEQKDYHITISTSNERDILKTYNLTIRYSDDSDATLKSIQVKDETGSETHDVTVGSSVYEYNVTVLATTEKISIVSMPTEAGSTVTVNGVLQQDQDGVVFDLTGSTNVYTIIVTAPNGVDTITYTLTVTREDSEESSGGGDNGGSSGGSSSGGSGGGSSSGSVTKSETTETSSSVVDKSDMADAINKAVAGQARFALGEADGMVLSPAALALFLGQHETNALVLTAEEGEFVLNANQFDLAQWAEKLEADEKEINLTLDIFGNEDLEKEAADKGFNALSAVTFAMDASTDSDRDAVTSINQLAHYAKLTLKMNDETDLSHIAVLRVDEDGYGNTVYTPVPFEVNGSDVEVYSKTLGTFVVVGHEPAFADTGAHWAQEAIETLADRMIVQGATADSFEPNRTITRAEFASLITRVLGLSPAQAGNGFNDVSMDAWYASSIAAAVEAGLINGYVNDSFKPNQTISREEMGVIIYRAMAYTGYEAATDGSNGAFTDAAEIQAWASDAVEQLVQNGILTGNADGAFNPAGKATRAESAAMLNRLLDVLSYNA